MGFLDEYPPDLTAWQHDDRIAQDGFAHRWRSRVAPANGEAFFDALVRGQLRPSDIVMDVGCGHGDYTCRLATTCAQVIGVDADPAAIRLARDLASERGVHNVRFETAQLPGPGPSATDLVDIFVCRRGPTLDKWMSMARRVGRPGAVLLGIHPTGTAGAIPEWNSELPEQLRISRVFGHDDVLAWVTRTARPHSSWWFDVPETFDDPMQLHARLGGGVAYQDVEKELTNLLARHGGSLELRHCRLVWRVDLDS